MQMKLLITLCATIQYVEGKKFVQAESADKGLCVYSSESRGGGSAEKNAIANKLGADNQQGLLWLSGDKSG